MQFLPYRILRNEPAQLVEALRRACDEEEVSHG